jgi:hypothetical protein
VQARTHTVILQKLPVPVKQENFTTNLIIGFVINRLDFCNSK